MNWLKNAPTSVVVTVIIVCGVGFLGLLAAFVYLEASGQDTADFRAFVNTLANLIMLPLVGAGTLAAAAAAKSSAAAEEQTNGHLSAKEDEIAALQRRLDVRQGPPYNGRP